MGAVVDGYQEFIDLGRVDDEKNVEEPFEPTALVLEEEAIPPAKGED
jgi:hypothetical protein